MVHASLTGSYVTILYTIAGNGINISYTGIFSMIEKIKLAG